MIAAEYLIEDLTRKWSPECETYNESKCLLESIIAEAKAIRVGIAESLWKKLGKLRFTKKQGVPKDDYKPILNTAIQNVINRKVNADKITVGLKRHTGNKYEITKIKLKIGGE